MDKEEIKIYLKDNPQNIKDILDKIGCHHVKIGFKRVSSALPDGDNNASIQITLNNKLKTEIYTRTEFENFEVKDFFSLIQFINDCNLPEAIQYVCIQCGFKYSNNIIQSKKSGSYSFLKRFKRSITKSNKIEDFEETILNESFTERFIRYECKLFSDDGINKLSQDKFGVSYDILDNRIVFPIRNDSGELLTFKGRTMELDYKIRGIPKYYYYYPYFGEYYLYGLYENYFDILSANEIYVGESEKFVMQLDSMNINNDLAVSKHTISPIQLNKLLKLGKEIVLAFDKDITLEQIFIECRKFKGLCNVYYIYDTLDLLKEKESPSDKGKDVFMKLLNECKFKYKGE